MLEKMGKMGDDYIIAPYFKTENQEKVGLSNLFYVKLKSLSDTILLKKEVANKKLKIIHQNRFMPLWYVLSVTNKSELNALQLANIFYESGKFQYAEPDFILDNILGCANDQLIAQLFPDEMVKAALLSFYLTMIIHH
jgi:hypothetical protein